MLILSDSENLSFYIERLNKDSVKTLKFYTTSREILQNCNLIFLQKICKKKLFGNYK